ncbi:MAG: Wzz/FepE/Etk N-terminal domain-containing protein, partial [Luteolibacter sp.]
MNPSQEQNEASLHAVDYWQVIKNRYGVILLTLLLVFMTASVITYVMPKKYESYATIEVKPRERTIDPLGGVMRSSGPTMTAQFFGTEFEKIKSRKSLARVIDGLDLVNKWGIDREMVLRILKGIVNTQNIRGTDLISIRVRHTNKEDARDITAEVARAYK